MVSQITYFALSGNSSKRCSVAMASLVMLSILLAPALCMGRVNPLRVITERSLRSEILIVLDTSGSMAWHPSPSYLTGGDCEGNRAGTVDLCGDGLCSGAEGSSTTPCPQDCPTNNPYTAIPGATPACNPSSPHSSRITMVKRVLRNLLPDLRKSASFGLVTFAQSGYFRYYPALAAGAPHSTSIFLSRTEMTQLGAWDSAASMPRVTFTRDGTTYTLLSSAGLAVDQDSLYAREDSLATESRFRWSTAGMTHSDGTHSWLYRGSYYTYQQLPADTSLPSQVTEYRGPQFVDGAGKTWVYHRFAPSYTDQGISASSSGTVLEPLASADDQTTHDTQLFRILARMNQAQNGGVWAWGGTPTGPSILTAEAHFFARQNGSAPFQAAGADPAAVCRPRFVLLLTDGDSNAGVSPITAARDLYNNPAFGDNHIKTVVVGLPGLPTSAISELDRTADAGDDGQVNNSATALFADNEGSLSKVLQDAFLGILQGDYTTTPAGVSSSGQTAVAQDMAVVSSTRYPGWKGRLRALNLTTNPPTERWEAGKLLNLREWKTRKLYSGYPGSNGGYPVLLLDPYGQVNLDGGCSGCGPLGIKQLWQQTTSATLPPDDELRAVVRWMAGKDRPWKLGPIFRSAPASVGPPPTYEGVDGREKFRTKYASRERLIYVTSNDGLLHAFRSRDGTEAFAYLPPNLLPAVHSLWKQGGQPTSPEDFRWILASSPRVEDIPPASASDTWSTQLLLAMGPGGADFVALDITNPSICKSAVYCALNEPPFRVTGHSKDLNMAGVLGQTWSTPSIYFYRPDPSLDDIEGHVAMGSGYSAGHEGHYYNRLAQIYGQNSAFHHGSSGALVDFATLADTAAAVDQDKGRQVVATYQGDLRGRLVRYHQGDPDQASTMIDAGAINPFYYSPATMALGSGEVMLATASGSQDEEAPPAGAEATLYLKRDAGPLSTSAGLQLSCKVSDLCSGGAGCPGEVPAGCKAPPAQARPVAAPLLLSNDPPDGQPQDEAFYLLYEPPKAVCLTGTSWLIRVAADEQGSRLISATGYAGVRATGISMVGGRIDLAVAQVGKNGDEAGVFTVMNALEGQSNSGILPYVETWREASR